jgi:hypothetical protein
MTRTSNVISLEVMGLTDAGLQTLLELIEVCTFYVRQIIERVQEILLGFALGISSQRAVYID